jgi:hypothetical protein
MVAAGDVEGDLTYRSLYRAAKFKMGQMGQYPKISDYFTTNTHSQNYSAYKNPRHEKFVTSLNETLPP